MRDVILFPRRCHLGQQQGPATRTQHAVRVLFPTSSSLGLLEAERDGNVLKWELAGFALRPGMTRAWENPHHTAVLFAPLLARRRCRKAALLQRMSVHCQTGGA